MRLSAKETLDRLYKFRLLEKMQEQRYWICFLLISLLFIAVEWNAIAAFITEPLLQLSVIAAVLFLIYAFIYLTRSHFKNSYDFILLPTFVLFLIDFILMFVLTHPFILYLILLTLHTEEQIGSRITIFMPSFFLAFLGAYFVRTKSSKATVRLGQILIALAVLLIAFYFFSGYVYQYYAIDDEEFIVFYSTKALLQGLNPYNYSISRLLYYNTSITTISLTTNNEIIGIFNYPALFLYTFVPFYFASAPSIHNLGHVDLVVQAACFIMIAILTVAFSLDKKWLRRPIWGPIFFLSYELGAIASVTTFLMFALLVLAYSRLNTKYSWLFLGLCLAIQEQLWIPIIFLMLYSLNNHGLRKGVYDMIMALLVFMVINAYFIALGPSTFAYAIFNPLQKLLFPNPTAFFGYYVLTNYHMLLGSFMIIFVLVLAFLLILFVHLNQKNLLGFFSLIPFLFLSHSLGVYYSFFVSFLVISLFIKEEKPGTGIFEKIMRERKPLVYAALALIIIAIVAVAYYSHLAYTRAFNLTITNQTLAINNGLKQSLYLANLRYNNMQVRQFYISFLVFQNETLNLYGVLNNSLIYNPVRCQSGNYTCTTNVNLVTLNGTSGNYSLYAHLKWLNQSVPLRLARLVIYTDQYFYVGPLIYNTSQ